MCNVEASLTECVCPSEIEYLAIPYSSPSEDIKNFRANLSDLIYSELSNEGRLIYAPISSCHHIAKKFSLPADWNFWKKLDEQFVKVCKRLIIIMLEGWENSVGVTAETEIAIANNIPIEYIDPTPYLEKLKEIPITLSFNEYQRKSALTDLGTSAQDVLSPGWLYYVLGIAGETGELMEKIKKLFRDKKGIMDGEFRDQVIKEMGDIFWYQARLLDVLGITMNEVAETNITKLMSRLERGKLHGDGDNR